MDVVNYTSRTRMYVLVGCVRIISSLCFQVDVVAMPVVLVPYVCTAVIDTREMYTARWSDTVMSKNRRCHRSQ